MLQFALPRGRLRDTRDVLRQPMRLAIQSHPFGPVLVGLDPSHLWVRVRGQEASTRWAAARNKLMWFTTFTFTVEMGPGSELSRPSLRNSQRIFSPNRTDRDRGA